MMPGLRRFTISEDGSATIEFLLWLPVHLLILTTAVDAAFLFKAQADITHVASIAARQLALEDMTAEEAVSYASTHTTGEQSYIVTVIDTGGADIGVRVELPFSSVARFGVLSLLNTAVAGQVTHRKVSSKVVS